MRAARRGSCTQVPAGCPLTDRQFEAMAHLAMGMTRKEAARAMGVTVDCVHTHVSDAVSRLDIVGRGTTAAVVLMKDSGWLGAPPRRPARQTDDGDDVTPAQRAYNAEFVRLCKERSPLGETTTAVAAKLVSVDASEPFARRDARAPHRPDIDTLLLRMALAFTASN